MNISLHAANNGSSEGERHHYSVHGADNGEEITESDRSRLLYDYFVNPIGRYHGKRDFDEIDRYGFDKRNFDEIDRFGFSKRSSGIRRPHQALGYRPRVVDRFGLNDLKR